LKSKEFEMENDKHSTKESGGSNPNGSGDHGNANQTPSRSWLWWAVIAIVLVIIVIFAASLVFGQPGQEGSVPPADTTPEAPAPPGTPEDEDELPPGEFPPVENTFTFTFENGDEAWIPGYADLPADFNQAEFDLAAEWRPLPSGLTGNGIYMQGDNQSADLFMYITNFLDGLDPNTNYQVTFYLDLATNVPEGMVGIGGSPGESVYVKAGATLIKPETEVDAEGWLRMNIDKGNPAQDGEDMLLLGNIANPDLEEEDIGQFAIKELDNESQEFTIRTDSEGVVWLIFGTDSGFEGLTQVYYDRIRVVFTPVEA
jgi:hypothetical protein